MSSPVRTRFRKGESGNPQGRPKKPRPHVSAFDIIFDQTLTVTQNGVERDLTVDEALQLQTYHAALKGSRMAIRAVLKMIAKREEALAKRAEQQAGPGQGRSKTTFVVSYGAGNADKALQILGIAAFDATAGAGYWTDRLKFTTWATQKAISRPGRRKLSEREREDVKTITIDPHRLVWPKGRAA